VTEEREKKKKKKKKTEKRRERKDRIEVEAAISRYKTTNSDVKYLKLTNVFLNF